MKTETGKIQGPLVLAEDLQLNGMVVGDTTVPAGRYLRLNGTVVGRLLIATGGRCDLNGTVNGSVHADGLTELRGTVNGRATGDGLAVDRNAVVTAGSHTELSTDDVPTPPR